MHELALDQQEDAVSERHDRKRASVADNVERQTGQSLDDWIEVIEESGLTAFGTIVDWLKREHGLGNSQARLVAEAHRDHSP